MKLKEGWKVPRRKNKVHALTSLGPQGQSGMDYDEMQNDKDQLKRSSVLEESPSSSVQIGHFWSLARWMKTMGLTKFYGRPSFSVS